MQHDFDLNEIFQQFFPLESIETAKALGQGNINDTYLIQSAENQYVLQRVNHLVFIDPGKVMENMQRIERHLSESANYPLQVLKSLATPDGHALLKDAAGNFWRLFPFYAHTYTPEGLVGPEIAYKAAKAYGAFSSALSDFPTEELHETIPGFHDSMQRWGKFLAILEKDPVGRVGSVKEEIAALFDIQPIFARIKQLREDKVFPIRVTHNDTKAGNVLFDENTQEALLVLDLDTVMPGLILSDFGDMVRTFCTDRYEDAAGAVQLQVEVLQALEAGYLSELAPYLVPAEREQMMLGGLWIIGEQALRFLSDYIDGDTYYKIKDADHNLRRARNQLSLYRALQDHLRV